jgi:glucosylceramidase
VSPGADRLASTSNGDVGVENVAFRNPDGTRALVVLNPAGGARTFGVSCSDGSFCYRLPAGAVATFCWP